MPKQKTAFFDRENKEKNKKQVCSFRSLRLTSTQEPVGDFFFFSHLTLLQIKNVGEGKKIKKEKRNSDMLKSEEKREMSVSVSLPRVSDNARDWVCTLLPPNAAFRCLLFSIYPIFL